VFSVDDRTVRDKRCDECGDMYRHVTGFIKDDGGAYAPYFAACHGHPEHEAQIDVVLGTCGVEGPVDDHVTFSCRLRPESAMAVDATIAVDTDDPLLGKRLSRAEALAHPSIDAFWAVVDFLGASDPTIHDAVYGGAPPSTPGDRSVGLLGRMLGRGPKRPD
jgi:hypothetical protein